MINEFHQSFIWCLMSIDMEWLFKDKNEIYNEYESEVGDWMLNWMWMCPHQDKVFCVKSDMNI